MAAGKVIRPTHCPHCQQHLRPEWIRCARCKQFLPESVAEPTTAALLQIPHPRWVWGASGAALLVAAIGLYAGLRSASEPSATPAEVTRPRQAIAPSPREIDTVARAQHESGNAQRAGYAAYSSGDLPSALAQYEAAVASNPSDPEARNSLGQLLVRQNRAADALPHFDEAVRLDGQRWAYRFNRARALGELNRWREAVREYRDASTLFPDDYPTHYNLGLALMRLKEYPAAVAALERTVALAPGEPSFLISLGAAAVGAERPDRAKAAFQQFLAIAPNDPEAPRVKTLLTALAEAGQP